MLKHILTGQPSSSAGSRLHHHNDFLPAAAHQQQQQQQQQQQHQYQQYQQQTHHGQQHQQRPGRAQSSADVYENGPGGGGGGPLGQRAGPQFASTRLAPASLNHSQLSVNQLQQRLLNASQHSHNQLNLSSLSASKHSVNSVSPVVGAHLANYADGRARHNFAQGHALLQQLQREQHARLQQPGGPKPHQQHQQSPPAANGGLDISRLSRLASQAPTPQPTAAAAAGPHQPAAPATGSSSAATATTSPSATAATTTSGHPSILPLNASWSSSSLPSGSHEPGPHAGLEPGLKEVLSSLGLLCLVSLLLALVSLTFLIRMSSVSFVPNSLISPEEFAIVYDVTLVLCALALSLNLCCLLVCAIQFLFAVKLVKAPYHGQRTNKYLQKSSISRVCAIGGFFISIPVFLTGMILYTFIQFQSTPAIVTSVFIGLGIVFCGCALVHTVFVWQKEKTNAMKAIRREQYEAAAQLQRQQTLHSQQQQQQHQSQQQQQQQQQHQAQQQGRCLPGSGGYGVANRLIGSEQHSRLGPGSSATHQHVHGHRHVSMSPPLLISSPMNGLQRNQVASPPATPGDRSPIGPAAKHARANGAREAAGSVSPGLPTATLDLSSANTNSPHELSTLV